MNRITGFRAQGACPPVHEISFAQNYFAVVTSGRFFC